MVIIGFQIPLYGMAVAYIFVVVKSNCSSTLTKYQFMLRSLAVISGISIFLVSHYYDEWLSLLAHPFMMLGVYSNFNISIFILSDTFYHTPCKLCSWFCCLFVYVFCFFSFYHMYYCEMDFLHSKATQVHFWKKLEQYQSGCL